MNSIKTVNSISPHFKTMNSMMQPPYSELLLRLQQKLFLTDSSLLNTTTKEQEAIVATACKKIETDCGYLVSPELLTVLCHIPPSEFVSFFQTLYAQLKAYKGSVPLKPFFVNFPQQVMQALEVELYIQSLRHYMCHWYLNTPEESRPPLTETPPFTLLRLGTHEDVQLLYRQLLGSAQPYTQYQLKDIRAILYNTKSVEDYFPDVFHCRENLAYLAHLYLQKRQFAAATMAWVQSHIRSATDLLRFCAAFSDGDHSLAQPTRFRAIPRKVRRFILQGLSTCQYLQEDIWRYPEYWKRLSTQLHPQEYRDRYPSVAQVFSDLHAGIRPKNFYHRVELALENNEIEKAILILQERPGELLRRIDHLLRRNADSNRLLSILAALADKIPTRLLLQLYQHFTTRNLLRSERFLFPKTGLALAHIAAETRAPLPESTVEAWQKGLESILVQRFASWSPLGKCYIDPELWRYAAPLRAPRSAVSALQTFVRGTRIPIQADQTLRFFLWWKNPANSHEYCDVDVSAAFYNEKYHYVTDCSYYNLHHQKFGVVHSGDIVNAPDGAAEYIDCPVQLLKEAGVRYIVLCVNSYSEQPFHFFAECYAGWMTRRQPLAGEIFEASTVENKIDIASGSKMVLPLLFDLQTMEMQWLDLSVNVEKSFHNNVVAQKYTIGCLLKAVTQTSLLDCYRLLTLHVKARGEFVDTPEEADTVFSIAHGFDPSNIAAIVQSFIIGD